ncbi:MAG: DUF2283 domain-containing protein [Candidatus Brocadiales bacterium]
MKITYDEQADAMYIYFSESPVATTKKVGEGVFVDLDSDGVIRGLEVLSPIGRKWVGKDKLQQLQTVLQD